MHKYRGLDIYNGARQAQYKPLPILAHEYKTLILFTYYKLWVYMYRSLGSIFPDSRVRIQPLFKNCPQNLAKC